MKTFTTTVTFIVFLMSILSSIYFLFEQSLSGTLGCLIFSFILGIFCYEDYESKDRI